jgi:hypothetical protein
VRRSFVGMSFFGTSYACQDIRKNINLADSDLESKRVHMLTIPKIRT